MAEKLQDGAPVIGGRTLTDSDLARLLVGLNMKDRYVLPPQNLGANKPTDASGLLRRDAFKAVGLDPNQTVRDQLGGPAGYDYQVYASKSDPRSFYLELRPEKAGQSTMWLKFTGKPGVDLANSPPPTPEQIKKTQETLNKASQYGDLDATDPSQTTLGRLSVVLMAYGVDPDHLDVALRTGDRSLIGNDMVQIYNAGKLHEFSSDTVDAALPITKNQDGSVATPQQIEMNKARNELMADNLYATIVSELLLNQKVATKDGQYYKTPDQVAAEINNKLMQLNAMRATVGATGIEPLYFSEAKQVELFSKGVPFRRDDIIRKDVLAKFADIVTPEPGFTKPEFTWGNSVEFMPVGSVAFSERIAQIDGLIAQAKQGKKVTYDYTVWKHYANKPVDEHRLGEKLEKKLIELADAGGEIHMTVDRTVAFRDPGVVVVNPANDQVLGGLLARLAAHPKVKLGFFNNDERGTSGDSNHSKSAVGNGYSADATAIVGGRNIHGDYYYGWMDTEFKIKGKLAQAIQRAQDDMWNQQARLHKRPEFIRNNPAYDEPDKQGDIIGLSTHEMPGPTSTFNGLIGLLGGLEMSGFECTIVQAYVLPPVPNAKIDPTLEAIKRAVRQGKIVNIITNSAQTIDTPQISSAILKYAAHLLEEVKAMPEVNKGALNIYMKKKWDGDGGATLHAKVSYDNRWYVSDTSNNLHANNFLQHESQRYYLDDELNEKVRAWGKKLMDNSELFTSSEKLKAMAAAIDASNAANPALNALITLFPYQV